MQTVSNHASLKSISARRHSVAGLAPTTCTPFRKPNSHPNLHPSFAAPPTPHSPHLLPLIKHPPTTHPPFFIKQTQLPAPQPRRHLLSARRASFASPLPESLVTVLRWLHERAGAPAPGGALLLPYTNLPSSGARPSERAVERQARWWQRPRACMHSAEPAGGSAGRHASALRDLWGAGCLPGRISVRAFTSHVSLAS